VPETNLNWGFDNCFIFDWVAPTREDGELSHPKSLGHPYVDKGPAFTNWHRLLDVTIPPDQYIMGENAPGRVQLQEGSTIYLKRPGRDWAGTLIVCFGPGRCCKQTVCERHHLSECF
jgi:hypothetical protein